MATVIQIIKQVLPHIHNGTPSGRESINDLNDILDVAEHRDIPHTGEIVTFLHCKLCVDEFPGGMSMADWQDVEVGYTEIGLQVWCRRHDCNILHIDFEGVQHPANTRR